MSNKTSKSHEHCALIAACGAYFKKNCGYDRAFEAMLRKWKQYGRVAGVIKLNKPTRQERDTLENFFSKAFPDDAVRFSMAGFEEMLQKTKFCGVSLEELMREYFQEELLTNQEKKRQALQQRNDFFEDLKRDAGKLFGETSQAFQWIYAVCSEKKHGYQLILREYTSAPESSRRQVQWTCEAISLLQQGEGIRLAVLASEITGNPHAFDRNTSPGKLLIRALSFLHGGMACHNAEEVLALYYVAGIKPDDISSFTVAYGVHLYTEQGEHPAYKSFIESGEPYVVTLSNLNRIKSVDVERRRVYLVENQMVFSQLCEGLQGQETAIICTSGQIKTASLILIDLLCEAGCQLLYSGDFDPEGLMIAERLLERHGDSVQLWCMDRNDYVQCLSEEKISNERMQKLRRIQSPQLSEVKAELLKEKRAGYQEQLLGKMQADILSDSKADQ